MGFNTIAFLLNDMMGQVERSPHAAIYAITHPMMDRGDDGGWWRHAVSLEADRHGERMFGSQALQVLPTWHANEFKIFLAGGNQIAELEWVQGGRSPGSNMAKVRLPEWWKHRRGR